jgi:hypothetical protein
MRNVLAIAAIAVVAGILAPVAYYQFSRHETAIVSEAAHLGYVVSRANDERAAYAKYAARYVHVSRIIQDFQNASIREQDTEIAASRARLAELRDENGMAILMHPVP